MRCPACTFENPDAVRFCGSCGAALVAACPSCGSENPPGFRFCGRCGSLLDEAREEPPGVTPPSLGERRRVTVLFADLVGFSTLAEHLDPEELRTLMTETFAELTEEVERRDGFVEKFIGDAVVAVFGAPVTHEDDPLRAVETAVAMHDVVRRQAEGAPAPLKLRVGVNSGLVVSGPVGDGTQMGIMGDAVNVAARLQQAAEPGDVLVAASTWRRVRGAFDAEAVGSLDVKGRAQRVEAYRLLGRHEEELRRRAPFVGRGEEFALLELLWSSVRKGNTHVVSVVGEPGVGKSRLLSEFRPEGTARDMRIACGGDRAFGPFLDLVAQLLGGLPRDADELTERLAAIGVAVDDGALLAPLLGLGGAPPGVRMGDEQRERQVFAGVWQFLAAAVREQPAVIALDDVHWADESSRALLGFLLERLTGVPLMLVLCYRPGFEHVERAELRASHTAVRLEPLGADESLALARGFLGVSELPADLERLIGGRAEGNPFFIEELLQALLELGSLAVVDGRAVLARVDVEVPDTVQGTILARVDRLEARERAVLQHAAALGRDGSAEVLEAVVAGGDISRELRALERAQLLVAPRPGEWAFKHALIQEVVYETLLLRQRRELHRKIAEALEPRAADDPTLLEGLAQHYGEAELPEQARRYALAAGDLALQRAGYVEAQRRYETALRLWGDGDEQGRLELLMKLGRTAHVAGDGPAARAHLLEAADGYRRQGDGRLEGEALAVLGRVYWVLGDPRAAADALERAIRILEELGPSPQLALAYNWASTADMLQDAVERAVQLGSRGLALADELGLDALRAHFQNTLGVCAIHEGDETGITRIEEALEIARETGDVEATGRAYTNLSDSLFKVGRLHGCVEVAEEGREAMRRLGSPTFGAFIAGNEAHALVDLGRLDEAEALTRHLLEDQRGVLGAPGVVNAGSQLALALARRGRYDEAREVLDEVVPTARRVTSAEFLSGPLAIEAQVEHARGNFAAAREALRESLELAYATSSTHYRVTILPLALRLLARAEAAPLVEEIGLVPQFPRHEACLAEIEALRAADPSLFSAAAERYRELEMPYDEARCRIDAGELERARELVDRFALGGLGAALAGAEADAALQES